MTADEQWLHDYYDAYPRIEAEFEAALEESLDPRGPGFALDVIAATGLGQGDQVVDVGCGEGDRTLELARRFGCAVTGVDPVPRHLEIAEAALAAEPEDLRARVRFVRGAVEQLPVDDGTADLVHCREVLYHVADLERAFAQCRRVMRPRSGRMVLIHLFATERLEPAEAQWFWSHNGTLPAGADTAVMERAMAAGGLRVEERIDLGSENGQWAEERNGKASRELRAVARLFSDPQRYVDRFGRTNYEIKLADAFWHVYRMMGKLTNRVYVLAPTG